MILSLLMNAGTFLSTAAAAPSMIAVLKNRNRLKGFSLSGTLMRIAAISCFTVGQAILRIWPSVILDILLVIYNLIVLFYVWRCRNG